MGQGSSTNPRQGSKNAPEIGHTEARLPSCPPACALRQSWSWSPRPKGSIDTPLGSDTVTGWSFGTGPL